MPLPNVSQLPSQLRAPRCHGNESEYAFIFENFAHFFQQSADQAVLGAFPVIHRISVPNTQVADIDVVLIYKTRIIEVWLVKTAGGGAGATITVKNGANAISETMNVNVAAKTVVRTATIDNTQNEIAAGGILRVTPASQPGVGCDVYVLGLRVP